LLSATALSSSAWAQSTTGQVETITVTAEKRVENVQDVPISMSVLSGSTLQDFHQDELHSIMNLVPNLFVLQSGVDDIVYIRGFGTGPNNIAFDQDVSVYQDGIYGGRSAQFMEPMFDIDHLEVLRGPQGALFGKNTAAGAISIVTAGPTEDFHASATTSYNFTEQGTDSWGYVSGPVTDDFGFRLAVKYRDQDGYLKNTATGDNDPHTDEYMGRLTFKWAPTANFNVTGKAEYGNEQITGGINVSGPLNAQVDPPSTRNVQEPVIFGQREQNGVISTNSSVTANYLFDGFTLTSVTGYSEFTTKRLSAYDQQIPGGGITGAPFANGFPETFNQESEEVRLLSPTGQTVEYIVGAYVDASDYTLYQFRDYENLFGAFTGQDSSNFKQHESSYSFFAQATYHVTDDLRLIGSARYTNTDKDAGFTSKVNSGVGLSSGAPAGAPCAAPYTCANGTIGEGSFDPSLTAQFDARKNVMFYATYAQGSKSGGFVSNTFGTTDPTFTFKPEKSDNYEVGMKGTFLDGRLVANGTLFNMRFKDLQESSFDPTIQSFITNNAGSATSRGFEGSLTWLPIDTLEFTSSFAYLEAKYDTYKGAPCLALDPTSVCDPTNTNPADPNSVVNHNIGGLPLLYASKWTGNVQVHHTLPIGSTLQLDTTLVASLRTRYFESSDYDPYYGVQPTYVKLDARVQLGDTNGKWDVAFVGKNLTNVLSVSDAINYPLGVDRAIKWVDEGRSIALEVSYHY
jgi:iron complex outermembrane receptor protein